MILIRVPYDRKTAYEKARDFADKLRKRRAENGLDEKFAIVLDIGAAESEKKKAQKSDKSLHCLLQEDGGGNKEEEEYHGCFVEKLRTWREDEKLIVEQYSDLLDLPCILILVEKGNIGDTFPASLRYYDLRMRYPEKISNLGSCEQSLGRACSYKKADYDLPSILLSKPAYETLSNEKNFVSLWEDPDTKMKRPRNKTKEAIRHYDAEIKKIRDANAPEYMLSKFYRTWFKPAKEHSDSHESDHHGNWKDNDHRFLLVGRPQIGKTGAFLYTLKTLHDWIVLPQRGPGLAANEEPAETEDSDEEDESEEMGDDIGLVFEPDKDERNNPLFGSLPPVDLLLKTKFDVKAGMGKYGAPNTAKVWDHFVIKRNRGQLAKPQNNPNVHGMTTAEQSSPDSTLQTSAQIVAKRRQLANECTSPYYAFGADRRQIDPDPNLVRQREDLKFELLNTSGGVETCVVSLVDNSLNREMWNFDAKVLCPALQTDSSYAPFPILMPTFGRPQKAKLDLRGMMENSKHVHIVCLKMSQFDIYRDIWPDHTFFVLPESAEDLGIGASSLARVEVIRDLMCCLKY